MFLTKPNKVITAVMALVLVAQAIPIAAIAETQTPATLSVVTDPYKTRFMDLWQDIHDKDNGYFSDKGIPYHAVETLIAEATDYGHVTTSEAFSYYMWLEAMYGKFTGDFANFETSWNATENYMIPSEQDQLSSSMKNYNPSSPATYAPEWETPDKYPAQLDFAAASGVDPISNELVSTYGTSTIYGMHWLLDVDNWYGYGKREDGVSSPSFINTFQRGAQESTFETIPQPCWDAMKFGGTNGYLDLFTGDKSYSQQFKYTDAPDADARAVQVTYWANEWAKEAGVDISTDVSKATKMGDYLRYSMFDKYFRKIGNGKQAGTGYDAAHYLLSWYYAWGGGVTSSWSWKIGSSHNHFGYQNPMAAWILSKNSEYSPKSPNASRDWGTSLDRQLEFYEWLQSNEGGIAGGATNSYNGRYETAPAGTSTFYGMTYDANPVYLDPGSNNWFGFQTWSMQRVAELYYKSGDARAKAVLDKWVNWVKSIVVLNADGTFAVPSTLEWSGQPDTWTGTKSANKNLHVTVKEYGTDLGVTASLANTLLYYSKASGDEASKVLAKELLDRMWTLYRDDKGLSAPEARGDYKRFFEQEVYVPSGWTGKMPNGDVIKPGIKFLDIRSKYYSDPMFSTLKTAYDNNQDPVFKYHRFWAQCEIAIANGTYSVLFEDNTVVQSSSISPKTATFDKAAGMSNDVQVALTLNGNQFSSITCNGTALQNGTDYTVSGTQVVISKNYLAQKAVGKASLVFKFSSGSDSVLTVDVVDTTVPVVTGQVSIKMFNGNKDSSTNGISPRFLVQNTGTTAVNFSDIKIRYYYTINGEKAQNFWCDWSSIGSSNVVGNFVKLDSAKTGADYYLEVSFTSQAGTLQPGQSAEVQTRFSKTDWTTYSQSDDYSFNSTASSYVSNDKVVAYVGSNVAYGILPQ